MPHCKHAGLPPRGGPASDHTASGAGEAGSRTGRHSRAGWGQAGPWAEASQPYSTGAGLGFHWALGPAWTLAQALASDVLSFCWPLRPTHLWPMLCPGSVRAGRPRGPLTDHCLAGSLRAAGAQVCSEVIQGLRESVRNICDGPQGPPGVTLD